MSQLQERFDALIEEQQQVADRFKREAQSLFKDITKEFFDKNPAITAIRWCQYTPYFNDGDTCVFGVNEPNFTNCPIDQMEDLDSWGDYRGEEEGIFAEGSFDWILKSDNRKYYAKQQDLIMPLVEEKKIDLTSINNFSKIVQSSEMESIMLAMFGDHASITATRDGFDVEEYDHD